MIQLEINDKNGDKIRLGDKLKFTSHKGFIMPDCVLKVGYDPSRLCFGVVDEKGNFIPFCEFDELWVDLLNHCEIIND